MKPVVLAPNEVLPALNSKNDMDVNKDPGWRQDPPGTLASLATKDELERDLGFVPTSQDTQSP